MHFVFGGRWGLRVEGTMRVTRTVCSWTHSVSAGGVLSIVVFWNRLVERALTRLVLQ